MGLKELQSKGSINSFHQQNYNLPTTLASVWVKKKKNSTTTTALLRSSSRRRQPTTCPSSAHSIPAETTRTTTTPRDAWWTIHPSASSPSRSHPRALPESPHCINFLNPLMRVHVHTYLIYIYYAYIVRSLIRYISSIRVPLPLIYCSHLHYPSFFFHSSALFMFLSSFPAKSLGFPMRCMCFCVCLQSDR